MERLGLGLWTRETGDSGQQTEKRRRTEDNILTVSIQPHAPRHRAIQRRRHTVRPQCTTHPVLRSGMVGTREQQTLAELAMCCIISGARHSATAHVQRRVIERAQRKVCLCQSPPRGARFAQKRNGAVAEVNHELRVLTRRRHRA